MNEEIHIKIEKKETITNERIFINDLEIMNKIDIKTTFMKIISDKNELIEN